MIHYTCDACKKPVDLNRNKVEDLLELALVTGYVQAGPVTGRLKHVCVPCQNRIWVMLTTKEKEPT